MSGSGSVTELLQKERRQKRQHNKTRSGCITCRRRHLKCDEGQPGCKRCLEGRRRCEGYNTPVPWLFEPRTVKATLVYQPPATSWTGKTFGRKTNNPRQIWKQSDDHSRSQSRPAISMYPLAQPLSVYAGWSEVERYKLWLYLQLCRSTLEVANAADVELFCTFLPQVCLQVLPIRFAISCYASYIGSLIDPSNADSLQLAAEVQYRQVLRSAASVQSLSTSSSWVELFLVSMVLRCLETYRNDYDRASTHLQGAMDIIQANGSIEATQSLDPCVLHIVNRLKAKIKSQSKALSHSPMSGFAKFNSTIDDICKLLHHAAEDEVSKPDRHSLTQKCISELDSSLPSIGLDCVSQIGNSSSIYLQIQFQICRLVLLNLGSLDMLSKPESYGALQNILDLCVKFSDLSLNEVTTVSSQGQRIRLGFGIEFISSVLFVATVCGSGHIRRSAISLLRSCYRQEWLWDSFQAAQIAEWLMGQEIVNIGAEQGSSAARPVITSAGFYQEGRDTRSSFRRPSWVQLNLSWPERETKHWLILDQPSHRVQSQTQASLPTNPVLCYDLQGPFWPSTALALIKSYTSSFNQPSGTAGVPGGLS